MKTITIASEFSRYPAGRYNDDGPYSGQLFRENHLAPAFAGAERVRVVLDGARGYGSSFLEEAFGGLVRSGYEINEVLDRLELVSKDPTLIIEILDYINHSLDKVDDA